MKSSIKIPKRHILQNKNISRPKRSKKSKALIGILLTISLVSIVLLSLPYIPRITFLIKKPKINPAAYQEAAKSTKAGTPVKVDPQKPGNRLVLPDIGVDTQVIEGKNLNVIGKNQGVWRESRTITPEIDGNLVIAGHRFLYTATNGGWFYNLPELKVGQTIYVRWNDKVYPYEVYRTRSVLPTQVDIRDAEPGVPRKLTMYTCYPLGSTSKRFVIEAKQIN